MTLLNMVLQIVMNSSAEIKILLKTRKNSCIFVIVAHHGPRRLVKRG